MANPNCPPQPVCGSQGDSTDDVGKIILAILGIGGTVIGIITTAAKATALDTLPILGWTAPGIGAIGLGAAAGAAAVMVSAFAFWWDRCLSSPDGLQSCSAGVVQNVVESFNAPADYMFPFIAQHNFISVVVKCIYWPLVQQEAQYILCFRNDSPAITCVYENPAVCAAAAGSFIGAVVGGVGGIVLGILAGAALGCTASGPFYLLCLLIAAIVAAIVAAVCALAGAAIGGNIGHAIAGDEQPSSDNGDMIAIGDYVTTQGKTIISGDFDHARVYWFVEHTTLHGHTTDPGPFFSHTDPDNNLVPDACPSTEPPPR
jgi:hypothetical protein